MAEFETDNSIFESDSSADLLAEVYAAEDNEDEEHKTESQQAYEGAIQPYMFEPRADDADGVWAKTDEEQSQNSDHLVDISLW